MLLIALVGGMTMQTEQATFVFADEKEVKLSIDIDAMGQMWLTAKGQQEVAKLRKIHGELKYVIREQRNWKKIGIQSAARMKSSDFDIGIDEMFDLMIRVRHQFAEMKGHTCRFMKNQTCKEVGPCWQCSAYLHNETGNEDPNPIVTDGCGVAHKTYCERCFNTLRHESDEISPTGGRYLCGECWTLESK